MKRNSAPSAFTLVEVMIVVAILANLALIAVPAYARARSVSQNSRFISDLRVATAAFEMYAAENNRYPNSAAHGTMPTGMSIYLNGMAWTSATPIGGRWDWEPNKWGFTAQLGVDYTSGPGSANDVRMADIDLRLDNGALSTGAFRKQDATNYMHIIE